MGVADDVEKLTKNQASMQKSITALKARVDELTSRMNEFAGDEDDYVPVKEQKKVLVSFAAKPAPKETPKEQPKPEKINPKPASKETTKIDENLGFKIFGAVGFFLILLGTFYLYSYAVAQGWISHLGRVILGVLFCALILAVGEAFRRKKYEKYSQLLTGGGLGLLYFITSATFYFPAYRTALGMTQTINALLLFIVAGIAVYLALRQDSQILTCFAFLLAFLSAIFTGNVHQTMIATLILAAGMSYIVAKKNWPLSLYPVVASYLVYTVFFFSHEVFSSQSLDTAATFIYLLLLFLLFNTLTLLLRAKEEMPNVLAAVINSFAVLAFGLTIVERHWQVWHGVFLILIAGAYFCFMALAKYKENRTMFETFFLLAITFITIAIPVQLSSWQIVIAWAIEGLLLVRAGLRVQTKGVRVIGYIALGLAALYMLLWYPGFQHGTRTISYVIVIAALYGTSYLLSKEQKLTDAQQSMRMVLEVVATIQLTIMIAVECMDPSGMIKAENVRVMALCALWLLEGLVLLHIGLTAKRRDLEIGGYVLLGFGTLASFGAGSTLAFGGRTFCYTAAVLALYLGAYRLSKEKLDSVQSSMRLTLMIVALTFLNIMLIVECMDSGGIFGPWSMRVNALTIIWAIEGLLLVHLASSRKQLYLEIAGYVILALCALFAFSFGSTLEAGGRTFAYLIAILALYGSLFLLKGYDTSRDLIRGVLVVGASLFLTLMFAVELSDAHGILAGAGESGRQVALSVVWALEAVVFIVVGFLGRSRIFRTMGAILFALTVGKILLNDLGALEPLYRTIVTMVVGIIALGAAFAYVKNKEKIQQFLEKK